jgi:hypothetical protein
MYEAVASGQGSDPQLEWEIAAFLGWTREPYDEDWYIYTSPAGKKYRKMQVTPWMRCTIDLQCAVNLVGKPPNCEVVVNVSENLAAIYEKGERTFSQKSTNPARALTATYLEYIHDSRNSKPSQIQGLTG